MLPGWPPNPRKVAGPSPESPNKTIKQKPPHPVLLFYWHACTYAASPRGEAKDIQEGNPTQRTHTRPAGPGAQRTWARLCFLYSTARLFSRSRTKARRRAVGKVTAVGWEQAGTSSVSHGHCRQLDAHGRPLERRNGVSCAPGSGAWRARRGGWEGRGHLTRGARTACYGGRPQRRLTALRSSDSDGSTPCAGFSAGHGSPRCSQGTRRSACARGGQGTQVTLGWMGDTGAMESPLIDVGTQEFWSHP